MSVILLSGKEQVGVQGLEPPKHFRWGAENPKIRKIVAQVTAIVAIVAKFYGGGSLDR